MKEFYKLKGANRHNGFIEFEGRIEDPVIINQREESLARYNIVMDKEFAEMKKIMALVCVAVLTILVTGCGILLDKEIVTQSQSARSDVFSEVNRNEPVPAGFGVIRIKSSVKTRHENYYFFKLGTSDVGKPGYPFVVNIDGQAMEWKIDGQKENTSRYDKGQSMPDGGDGMRYVLDKTIKVKTGPHRIFVGFPRDNAIVSFDLNIKEGHSTLEIVPLYKIDPMTDVRRQDEAEASFIYGIRRLEVYDDGEKVKSFTDTILRRVVGQ